MIVDCGIRHQMRTARKRKRMKGDERGQEIIRAAVEVFGRNGFGIQGTVNGNVIFDGQDDFPIIIHEDFEVAENASLTIT